MLKEFRKATGGDASEGVKEILDLVKMDWPGAAKAMERLGKFLGDTVTVPGSEGHKPLALPSTRRRWLPIRRRWGKKTQSGWLPSLRRC